MAYCRISDDSDVYLYTTGPDPEYEGVIGYDPTAQTWVCCGCLIDAPDRDPDAPADEPAHISYSASDALAHLRAHQTAGHKVAQYAIDALEASEASLTQTAPDPKAEGE